MKKILLIIATVLLTFGVDVKAQTLAFPTAEGFGAYAIGGRGGKVVAVTNLEDDDLNPIEGSFRWALQQYPGEPITIIFKVSGVINLAPYVSNARRGELKCKRNNFTIAGQTAPGDGICIKGNKVNFGGSTNFIIRHMRFRIGVMLDGEGNPHAAGNGSIGIENASDFIIDHCTFGWSGEENMTVYDNKNTTVQWSLVHEGLYMSGHNKGARSYAAQWGGQTATYHHNLLAHNVSRSTRFNGARSNDHDVLIDYVNNINYNWGKQNSCYGGDFDAKGVSHRVNFVNNYYKPGPARPADKSSYFVQSSFHSEQTTQIALWWMSGNIMEGNESYTANNYLGLDKGGYPEASRDLLEAKAPFDIDEKYRVRSTESAANAYSSVLDGVGAFPRDAADARIVNDVRNGTASGSGQYGEGKGMIDDPEAVGGYPVYNSTEAPLDTDGDGMPDAWEIANSLDSNNAEDGKRLTASGYTAFEVYLNGLVGEHIDLDFTSVSNEFEDSSITIILTDNTLSFQTTKSIASVTLYNALGQVCLFEYMQDNVINISSLNKGLYIVKAGDSEGKVYVSKILK